MKNHSVRIESLEARIAPAFGAVFELSGLDGLNGFKLSGVAVDDRSGYGVSDAGDINGDGFDDVIIGAPYADPNGSNTGASYLVFGKADGFAANLNLSTLNGDNGFKISGIEFYRSGESVSAAGDVNGDGFDDLIVGGGATHVVFGKSSAFAPNLDLDTLDGSNGFRFSASVDTVSAAGDVNGDGFGDLILGNGGGIGFVVFGKDAGFPATVDASALDGANGFRLSSGQSDDLFGYSVSGGGDVNGDGFADLIIGALQADPNGGNSGASYVVFGKAGGFAADLSVTTLNGGNGFRLSGAAAIDFSGGSVSSAGDVNGDGFDDLIIGAPGADPNGFSSGASYVVFGKLSGFTANLNLSSLNGSTGFKLSGVAAGDNLRSVSTAGDVNGDGFDDLIVGAGGADPNGNYSGASYVVFGKASGFAANINLSTLNGLTGFKLNGVTVGDRAGRVSTAGDVNRDGFDDVIIGASNADPNGSGSGASYVVFGSPNRTLSISDGSVAEGDATTTDLIFTVTLSAASAAPVTVRYTTSNGTAEAGSDFTAATAEALTFAPGETSKMVTVKVPGDVTHEADERFSVSLSTATNGVTIDQDAATGFGTILNDDAPPQISIAGGSVLEGLSGPANLSFTVSLSAASGLPVTVNFGSADGTALAGNDYTVLTPGTLSFAPGETTKTISVEVLGDAGIEDDETLSVTLTNPVNAVIATGTAVGTILNDDTAVRITGPADQLEGDSGTTPFVFSVSLEKASALPVTVSYATADGTATDGSDFNAAPAGAQVSFAPGETTKTVTIDVVGDTSIEDHESFSLLLSDPINATLASGTAPGIILNDDTALHINDVSAREGDAGATSFVFSVTLQKPSAIPVTVSYATADGTANAGSDYEAAAATQLSFAPGETTRSVSIAVTGDTEVEAHETFSVLLSAATGATIAQAEGTGTILNDETLVRITDESLLEGHTGTRAMIFTVSLSAETTLPVSVNFASADGTATAGTDYTALTPGTLDFAPGETSKTVTVEVLGDIAVEPVETFSVELSEAGNAVIEDGTGTGTILDDDVTLVGTRKATFTDEDGDVVRIKVSKGTLKVEDFTLFPAGSGSQLALVDFSGETEFTGANLSISAKGGGAIDVGYINAAGIDLGAVAVKGDLGQIDVGNPADQKAALRSLTATSLGARGVATQLPNGSLQSDIDGAFKKLKLANGMHDATLLVSGDIGGVKIKGDVLGSAIRTDGKIGTIKIGGDLAASDLNAATISARGILSPASIGKALAIGNLSIGGSVDDAQILAGYDRAGAAANADAGIGTVIVGGAWIASNLVAGVNAGPDGLFGTDDDASISPVTSIVSRIASILIKGTANGTEGGTDHFGFVAEQIDALKAGGTKLQLTRGPGNDVGGVATGTTGDFKAREVA